jgi:hypothetical protein
VRIDISDALGRRVAVLAEGLQPAGTYEIVFEADNLPSGVYLCRMQAGAFTQTRRMLVVK